ncbi:MAG: hypothetical protein VX589_07525 [Myxococcota bacterium]|nr:hypothetical protein [Myxococcota bacterium]
MSTWLCFVPLFNLLAFEYCLAISVPLVIGAGLWGIRIRHRQTFTRSLLPPALLGMAIPLAVALTVISANAGRVQNCDYLEGLTLFALFTLTNTLIALLWGLALGRFKYAGRMWFFCLFGSVILAVIRFLVDPPVDIFHHFLGYYPGALYDDVFLIDDRILWSRAEDVGIACLVLSASSVYPAEVQPSKRWTVTSICATLACLSLHQIAVKHDVYRDAEYVQAELGGHLSTPSISLYYPKAWKLAFANNLLTDLEFAFQELSGFFEAKPTKPIVIYAYRDADQKKRLMGARRTKIAKPWQWTFHVDAPRIGQPVLIHEMAHIFAGTIGHSPHHISLNRWGLPNMGIIEGVAEAATWQSGQLDLHQWTAALHRLGLAPPLKSLVRPDGFYAQYARTAYTMCGSLTRYIVDKYGRPALTSIYQAGDFAGPLDLPLDTLTEEWKVFLSSQEVPELALAATKAKYDRPSIFAKVCAREIAALRREASQRFRAGKWQEAKAKNRVILTHIPDDIRARLQLLRAEILTGDLNAAKAIATGISSDERSGAIARHTADESLADIALLRGQMMEAEAGYLALRPHAFSRSRQRVLAVKLSAVRQPTARNLVIRYLTGAWNANERKAMTARIVTQAPNWPIGHYLEARTKIGTPKWASGIEQLNGIVHQLEGGALKLESWQLMASTLFSKACYENAARIYRWLAASRALNIDRGERNILSRWGRRADFFAQKNGRFGPQCRAVIDIELPDEEYPPKLGNTPSIE